MRNVRQTYNESWYRIAELRPTLRPTVQIVRQHSRGKIWYVLRESTSNATIRLRDEAYAFLAMLDGRHSVGDVWNQSVATQGDQSLTQGEVVQLLGQLYTANYLRCEMPADSELLFQRFTHKRTQKVKSTLSNFLFIRVPLIDPDSFFSKLANVVGWLFSWKGLFFWALVLLYSGQSILNHWDQLSSEFNTLLDPANLFFLYISTACIKLIHECGHGVACKWLGRSETAHEVRTLGVMFLVLMPMPYVDVSSCWMFRSKWKRIVVSLGGMYVELLVAAFAGMLWAHSGAGTLLHSLAYNMMVTASIGTLLFNANPLMRFDGYYAIIDWLEIPNLYTASTRYLTFLGKRIAWGVRSLAVPASSIREAILFTVYGILSLGWRVWISVGIILFVAGNYFFLGAIMAIVSLVMWVILPLFNLVKYLFSSHELTFHRLRACITSVSLVFILLIFVGGYKVDDNCRVEGTVEPVVNAVIYAGVDGYLEYCLDNIATLDSKETTIAKIDNPSIESEIRFCQEELNALEIQIRLATQEQRLIDIRLFEARKQAFLHRLAKAEKERDALQIKTSLQGVWEAERLHDYLGAWVSRGQILGKVIGPDTIRLRVVVDQDEASRLFDSQGFSASYRIAGRPDIGEKPMPSTIERIIPIGSQWLPSPALGFFGGGHQPVDHKENKGQKSLSNVFEVWLKPEPPFGHVLLAGQRVIVRFAFPEQPLAMQWWRKGYQLFAKRNIQG